MLLDEQRRRHPRHARPDLRRQRRDLQDLLGRLRHASVSPGPQPRGPRLRSMWRFEGGYNLVLKNMTILGSNGGPNAGIDPRSGRPFRWDYYCPDVDQPDTVLHGGPGRRHAVRRQPREQGAMGRQGRERDGEVRLRRQHQPPRLGGPHAQPQDRGAQLDVRTGRSHRRGAAGGRRRPVREQPDHHARDAA